MRWCVLVVQIFASILRRYDRPLVSRLDQVAFSSSSWSHRRVLCSRTKTYSYFHDLNPRRTMFCERRNDGENWESVVLSITVNFNVIVVGAAALPFSSTTLFPATATTSLRPQAKCLSVRVSRTEQSNRFAVEFFCAAFRLIARHYSLAYITMIRR